MKPENHRPHSLEAEQSVLGAILTYPDAWERIAPILREEHFYHQSHRVLFHHLEAMARAGAAIDVLTVDETIQSSGDRDKVGGLADLAELANAVFSIAPLEHHARIVRDKAILRMLMDESQAISELTRKSDGKRVADIALEAEARIFGVVAALEGVHSAGPVHLEASLHQSLQNCGPDTNAAQAAMSGIAELDAWTTGLHPGDSIIIGGRPSMGKTALALSIARHVAQEQGRTAAVFSMEMPATQISARLLAATANVPLARIRSGKLTRTDVDRITRATDILRNIPIHIDESARLTPVEIRARSVRLLRQTGSLGVIIIDYLQLLDSGERHENRNAELTSISRAIKAIARDLSVPVVALSQLNRGVETRQDKRPLTSDLRESGAIEQDADLILLLYRDELYYPNHGNTGHAEIIIDKQRNGPTGVVHARFDAQTVCYRDRS